MSLLHRPPSSIYALQHVNIEKGAIVYQYVGVGLTVHWLKDVECGWVMFTLGLVSLHLIYLHLTL